MNVLTVHCISLALAMGLMVSPASLTILGNNLGLAGIFFLVILVAVAILHIINALSYGEFSAQSGPASEALFLKEVFGSIPAIILPLSSRLVFTFCASTSILTTAGYVFNEVFIFWFPNLGFSFCLLVFLLGINLLGPRVALAAQIFFVSGAIFPLILLSLFGLIQSKTIVPPMHITNCPITNLARATFSGLTLFVGFDLAGMLKRDKEDSIPMLFSMIFGIVFVGAVLCLWGLTSMIYVPSERLIKTTVPYMVSAREILGQSGRFWMGIGLLAGACSTVNALFIAIPRMIADMAQGGLLPSFFGRTQRWSPIPLLFLATVIAVMMAMGMAGKPVLGRYVKASLWFWMLHYAAVHLSLIVMKRRTSPRSHRFHFAGSSLVPVFGLGVMVVSLIGLVWFDQNPASLVKAILSIFASFFFLSLLWIGLQGRTSRVFP